MKAREPYLPPVDALLTLGHPAGPDGGGVWGVDGPWYMSPFADFAAMGLTRSHVPELLRMMRDPVLFDSGGDDFFACVHATRAAGVLGGMDGWPHLVDLARRLHRLQCHHWIDDITGVIAAIGPDALSPAMALARDHRETFGFRLTFLGAPEMIVAAFPELRGRVIERYTQFLDDGAYDSGGVNEYVVELLVKLSATEALPAIELAYARGYINDRWCGDLEHVRIQMATTPEERRAGLERAVERIQAEDPASGDLLVRDLERRIESDS
jgi:hypothetical protein